MATKFSRTLARNLRDARRDSPEKFSQELGTLFEAMGYEGGISHRTGQAHRAWDRSAAQIGPADFSLRELYANLVTYRNGDPVGHEFIESGFQPSDTDGELMEANAVLHSNFSNIVGQIEFTAVLEGYMQPDFIGANLVTVVPTDIQEEEKIPGISEIGDEAENVGESYPYPEVGVSEEWVTVPERIKQGFICSLSKEAVRGDKTALLIQRCQGGSTQMGINQEKERLDVALGVSTLYRRNGGAAQATYGNTHTQGDFDNLGAAALQDWTDIETALLLFTAIDDPNTGEPISLAQRQVVVPPALEMTLARIINATEVRETTNTNTQTLSPNPLGGRNLQGLSNQYVADRGGSSTAWWIGDFQRAFVEMENWPITVEEQRESSDAAFERDIILRSKVSRKGRVGVKDPRYVVEGNS